MKALFGALTAIPIVVMTLAGSSDQADQAPRRAPGAAVDRRIALYDPDPAHPWNRLDRLLRVRTAQDGREHGADAVDPLLWRETKYLLEGPSHEQAITLLDSFLDANADRLVQDPVKRILLQRDLWAIFDWAVGTAEHHDSASRNALASRLARVIRRLALTPADAERLAVDPEGHKQPLDTYMAAAAAGRFSANYDPANPAAPFLPVRMLDADGPWVPTQGSAPLAQHADEMSRSYFAVLLNVPGGRRTTLDYLRRLWNSTDPFTIDAIGSTHTGELRTMLRPELRAIPGGSQVALLRRMLFIDAAGDIRYSNIVESIQLRVFRARRDREPKTGRFEGAHDQDFFEFVLDRQGLLTNIALALRAVGREEANFLTFSSHGVDPFELHASPRGAPTLQMCANCHHEQGLASVLSHRRLFKPSTFPETNRRILDGDAGFWKTRRADWGQLQAHWQSQPF
jgi:hypothetical protein